MSKEKTQPVYDILAEIGTIAGNLWVEGEVVPEDEINRMVRVLSITLEDVKRLQEAILTERVDRPKMSDTDRARIDRALGVLRTYVAGLTTGCYNGVHNISGLNITDAQVLELIAMMKGIE